MNEHSVIFMATAPPTLPLAPILKTLKDYLTTKSQEKLAQVILFGSQARQEATPASDIDVLIVLNDPVNPSAELHRTSHFIAQLCLDHDLLISRFFMARSCKVSGGESRFETENSPLLRNIRQEGIAL
jgi:predicted nucleotidyltransferase